MQHSFHAGEFAPALYARVDLAKYKSGLALARNCFVDYRGGVSSRMGTKFINQCFKSDGIVRLIPFQASFTLSYILEFGDHYIRFYRNGNPVLEDSIVITDVTGDLVTAVHDYAVGDWVFIDGVVGIDGINGRYFQVSAINAGVDFNIVDLFGNTPTFTGAYVSDGTTQRVYTLTTPYLDNQLALIKFAQNVNTLILCHPHVQPQLLTYNGPIDWSLNTITFGATIPTPVAPVITTGLAAGTYNYSYLYTAVDANGQESAPSPAGALANVQDLRTVAKSNVITLTAVPGATSYNVYKAEIREGAAVPAGAAYGFIGNCTGTVFIDSNIPPDFSQGVPQPRNPFLGSGVASVVVTNPGTIADLTAIPTVTFDPSPNGVTAAGQVQAGVISVALVNGGTSFNVGDVINLFNPSTRLQCTIRVTAVAGTTITSADLIGTQVFTGTTPDGTTVAGKPRTLGIACQFNATFGVTGIILTTPGSGYTSVPAITFSSTAATATAVLNTLGSNPTVPTYMQQRLVLAGPTSDVQQFNFSQPSLYFNFDVTDPIEADDAIQGTLVSTQLNTIKALVPMSLGLVVLTDKASWLINGGSQGSAITPFTITANEHSYNGATDVPPIVTNFDILYVQAKGSIVRDLTFNYYAQIYTGTDISVLSSHLFYGFTILEWSYAEEPFKLIWAVRDDGVLLTLTFLKEQDIIGWCHSDTTNGLFKSTASVVENTIAGNVDATYFVVERVVQGQTLKYIERMQERVFIDGVSGAWCVDCGAAYIGSPATTVFGLYHLIGQDVTGLADGVPFTATVTDDGSIVIADPASVIIIGLPFTPQWQTLRLDVSDQNIQGKRKAIGGVNLRVEDTLGLTIGKDFSNLVPMKDLIRGNIGTQSNQVVTDLVTGDVRTIIDPSWDVDGQYCIEQSNPYPATILGVMPEIELGDGK
ncbi:MAG TPA: hypothetical protein VLG09_04315 [Candidatus Saccharimonadales bacterium]|nr:hypothetical protein [Candidatus Saccharimonadales bacterium]